MKRNNFNDKASWGGPRTDAFPANRFGSRQPNGYRRDWGGFYRSHMGDGEDDQRPTDGLRTNDLVGNKLDRVLDKLDKFDMWREETDRRFDNLDSLREADQRPRFTEGDDTDFGDFHQRKYGDKGFHNRNPNFEYGDGRERDDRGWGSPGYRQPRAYTSGADRSGSRPISCWDPPQRYQAQTTGIDKYQRLKMDPPRFDGSDANNWISRVQYYFDHLMMPDAQRLHYAVMLFDQPAAEWVFNYSANNEFVTWQDFLEDVRHRFDRKSFKDYFGLLAKLSQTGSVLDYHDTFEKYLNRVQGVPESRLLTLFVAGLKPDMQERVQLHRPSSLAAAMALVLELADSQADRATQPTTQRRPWQNRTG